MTPNLRRLIANHLTTELRKAHDPNIGWRKAKATRAHSWTGNPKSNRYRVPGSYPHPAAKSELISRLEYVEGFIERMPRLGTPDTAWALSRTAHDRLISRLPAQQQVEYVSFLEEWSALPFHAAGERLRWDARKAPAAAARALLTLTRVVDLQILDPGDTDELLAKEEDRMIASEVFAAIERARRESEATSEPKPGGT